VNAVRKKVARLAGLSVVSAGLVLGQGAISPANAAELIQDGGFEATVDGDAPDWVEADSEFGTPLCDLDSCGQDEAHGGSWWAWFGGTDVEGHTGSMSQDVTIPTGTHALTYWYWDAFSEAPFDTTLTVNVDGTPVKSHTEVADADTGDYTQQFADISAFADGESHTVSFDYLNTSAGSASVFVDDVSIDTAAAEPATTATPTVGDVDPVGPSSSTTPMVTGTAEAGSTVTLYDNSSCTGPALGTGSDTDFAADGIEATVPNNSSTTIYARASGSGKFDSECSASSVTYVNDSTTPNTTISSPSAGSIVKSLDVPITFTSSEAGSTFMCMLDGAAASTCTSPATVHVTAGDHTFKVAAKDAANNTDASPASVTFTAYDCTTLNAAKAAALANSDTAAKAVSKAKKAVKKAKKTHNKHKVKKAKKKLKKAKAAQQAAAAALASATASAVPCTAMSPMAAKVLRP
jgi:hypothetical protein